SDESARMSACQLWLMSDTALLSPTHSTQQHIIVREAAQLEASPSAGANAVETVAITPGKDTAAMPVADQAAPAVAPAAAENAPPPWPRGRPGRPRRRAGRRGNRPVDVRLPAGQHGGAASGCDRETYCR